MNVSNQIAITGVGAVCGAGLSVDAIWNAIISGKSAIAPIEQWDASRWPVKLSAEVRNVDNRTLVEDRKLHKMISRTDLFGLFAAHQAVGEFSASVNPMWLLRILPNNVLCHVGIRYGFKGTNACVTNQCVSGVL